MRKKAFEPLARIALSVDSMHTPSAKPSSNPRITLLDVNVLIALCDASHVHHALATEWFVEHAAQGWASCPLTQNGAIRIMSNPKYPNPRSLGAVIAQISQLCSTAHHHFWGDSVSLLDTQVFKSAHLLGHNQITDVYLLALAVRNEGVFLTMDGGISLQPVLGAQRRHLDCLV